MVQQIEQQVCQRYQKKKKKNQREAAHRHFSIGKYKQKPNIGFKNMQMDQLL